MMITKVLLHIYANSCNTSIHVQWYQVTHSDGYHSLARDINLVSNVTVDAGAPKLLQEVGRGGYGVVYQAIWRGSVVAAKVLTRSSTLESSVMREAENLKWVWHNLYHWSERFKTNTSIIILISTFNNYDRQLHHPNIVCIMGVVKEPQHNSVMIMMNYIDGSSLYHLLFDSSLQRVWLHCISIAVIAQY